MQQEKCQYGNSARQSPRRGTKPQTALGCAFFHNGPPKSEGRDKLKSTWPAVCSKRLGETLKRMEAPTQRAAGAVCTGFAREEIP